MKKRRRRTEKLEVTTEYDADTGEILLQEWIDPDTGEQHRSDGPAYYELSEDEGRLRRIVQYARQGVPHRDDDLPAYIVTDVATDVEFIQIWYQNGQSHREGDRPAYVRGDAETGVIEHEEYRRFHVRHRDVGPAVITRDIVTGEVTGVWTYRNGVEMIDRANDKPTLD